MLNVTCPSGRSFISARFSNLYVRLSDFRQSTLVPVLGYTYIHTFIVDYPPKHYHCVKEILYLYFIAAFYNAICWASSTSSHGVENICTQICVRRCCIFSDLCVLVDRLCDCVKNRCSFKEMD